MSGAGLAALGAIVLWHIQGYPAMPGQKFGPAWFPGLVAIGLIVCGALLAAQGVRSRAPLLVLPAWIRSARAVAVTIEAIAGTGGMKNVTGTRSAVAMVAVRPGTAPTNRPNIAEPKITHST